MKFYKKLYIGESIKKPRRVIWKLRTHAGQLNIYVITAAEGSDQLEFYHSAFLKQKYYRKHPPYIIGIAGGREEALKIVEQITVECYERMQTANLKEYLCI
jgi:hypothetical protein